MLGTLNIWNDENQQYEELPVIKGSDVSPLVCYPIGSYFMSDDPTSPAELFGGVWEQVKDRFILAAGDNYEVGSQGGEAEVTLTVKQMPAHSHYVDYTDGGASSGTWAYAWEYGTAHNNSQHVSTEGGSAPHNNMPPYETAYIWKRIE